MDILFAAEVLMLQISSSFHALVKEREIRSVIPICTVTIGRPDRFLGTVAIRGSSISVLVFTQRTAITALTVGLFVLFDDSSMIHQIANETHSEKLQI